MTVGSRSFRQDVRRVRELLRRVPGDGGRPPVPPRLPTGEIVEVPGHGETFVRTTDGDFDALPVLLLHGWAATADLNWLHTYAPLAADRRVIAPDHPGHGRGLRSEVRFSIEQCADVAAGVLDALDVPRALVVGYSMGGPIALRLWERHPDKVAGLVLGATALRFTERPYDRWVWRAVAVFEWILRATSDRWFLRRVVREVIDENRSMEQWRGWLFGELERGNPRDIRDAGVALSRFDGTDLTRRIDVPRAVVLTDRDQLVPPDRQRELAGALGAPTYVIHADHSAPMVTPRPFVVALREALRAVETQVAWTPTGHR